MMQISEQNLSCSYYQYELIYEFGRPASPSENKILLIDGTLKMCEKAASCGWQVTNLVFSSALYETQPNSKFTVIQRSIYGEWTKGIADVFDKIVAGNSIGYVENPQLFLKNLKALSKVHGTLVLQFANSLYYQRLIDKSTRELLPWPKHLPQGNAYTRKEIEGIFEESVWIVSNVKEEFDSLYYDANYSKWQYVNGIDCKISLPLQQDKRKEFFIKEYVVEAVNGSPAIISAANRVEGVDVEQVHRQIQTLLSDAQTVAVKGMLDSLIESGRANDMTKNLYGIYYYYMGDYQQAYILFIDAIEQNGSVADYYLNLYDVSKQLGFEQEFMHLAKAALKMFPHLEKSLGELLT